MVAADLTTLTVAGVTVSITSPLFWLVIAPAAFAAGFRGPRLTCEAAWRLRPVLAVLAVLAFAGAAILAVSVTFRGKP